MAKNKPSAASSFLSKNARPYHDTEDKEIDEDRIAAIEKRIAELEERMDKINFFQQELLLSAEEISAVIQEIMSKK